MSTAVAPLKGGALPGRELEVRAVEGEARILDTDLAERLGFAQPVNIRNLIRRHALALAELGILFTVEGIPVGRGRPGKAYYLNRPQALFVTAKSETDLATHITVEVVRKFDEYERGAKPPVPIGGELSAGGYHRIGGIVKAVTGKAIEDRLGPIEEKLRRIANGIAGLVAPSVGAAIERQTMLQVLIGLGVPAEGRRRVSSTASGRLRRWADDCKRSAEVRRSLETSKLLFGADLVRDWLAEEGRALIAAHRAALKGQPALPLRAKRRKPAAAG